MSSPLVVVESVWKAYRPGLWVLRDISFEAYPGDFIVIVGANGTGKTTLLKIITGLLRPSRGRVLVCGSEPWDIKAKKCIGAIMHSNFLYEELTVLENLQLYAGLNNAVVDNPEELDVAEKLGVNQYINELVSWLSFGWRRRSDIVRALLHNPRVIVIDEPFTGLDKNASRSLLNVMEEVVEKGSTMIVTTPKGEEEVVSRASRVALIRDGSLEWLKNRRD